MGITLTDFVDDFDKFITKDARVINKRMLQGGDIASLATTRMSNKGVYQASSADIGEVMQGFHKNFHAKGSAEFKPIEIPVRRIKVDYSIFPDDIEDEWLGFLYQENLKRTDMPIVRWVIENKLMPALSRDLELASYAGVYTANNGSGPHPAMHAFDGLETIINNQYTSGRTMLIATGPITKANIFDKVEEFIDGFGEEYDEDEMQILMSNRQLRDYFRARRNTHGNDTNYQPGAQNNSVDFSDFPVNGVTGMRNKNRIVATPRRNLVRLIERIDPEQAINWEIQQDKREVIVMADFHYAVGLLIPEAVAHTDGEM